VVSTESAFEEDNPDCFEGIEHYLKAIEFQHRLGEGRVNIFVLGPIGIWCNSLLAGVHKPHVE